MAKREPAGLSDLLMQARITNKLLVLQVREKVPQKDLVRLLMGTGATDQEVADALGTTPATVAVTKVRIRKEASARGKTAKASESENG